MLCVQLELQNAVSNTIVYSLQKKKTSLPQLFKVVELQDGRVPEIEGLKIGSLARYIKARVQLENPTIKLDP